MLPHETQVEWTASNLDKLESHLKQLRRELIVIGADSKQWQINQYQYLLGGALLAFLGKSRALTKENETYESNLGN